MVLPLGIEPRSFVSKTNILSIELQEHYITFRMECQGFLVEAVGFEPTIPACHARALTGLGYASIKHMHYVFV